MRSFDHLRDEHRMIEALLDRATEALARSDIARLRMLIEPFVDFVDRIHHTEEETVLFEALRDRSEELVLGPLAVLEREHGETRAHLKNAFEALGAANRGEVEANARFILEMRAYVDLVRSHMRREDELVFPMMERLLAGADDDALLASLMEIEQRSATKEDFARWEVLSRDPHGTRADRPPPSPHESPTVEVGPPPLDARTLAAVSAPPAAAGSAGVLYDDGRHRAVLLHDFAHGLSVQTNQFLIVGDGEGMILDPGGPKIYSAVFAEMQRHVRADALRHIFLSHQDPDIGTSINAWLMDTDADAHISRLWIRFLPHFGIDKLLEGRLISIPDEGKKIMLGEVELELVPAHFLHSPGNFQVYDPRSKILFSGDLGASVEAPYSAVEDFDRHIHLMRFFHRRYMTSNRAMRFWAERVRKLDIETIAPQHGAIFRGRAMVERFIDWCASLECGVDLLG